MEENFVSYNLALKLKELGFNRGCFAFYNQNNELESFDSILTLAEDNINSNLPDINDYLCDEEEVNYEFCTAPLYQQVTKWLREVYGIHIHISRLYCYVGDEPRTFDGWCVFIDNGIEDSNLECNDFFIKNFYKTYEQSLEAALEESLKLIKNESNNN